MSKKKYKPDKYDGALTFSGANGRSVTVWLDTESGWISEDMPELARLLSVAYPYPPLETGGLTPYQPNPALAVLRDAAAGLGATITQEPYIEREPGIVY